MVNCASFVWRWWRTGEEGIPPVCFFFSFFFLCGLLLWSSIMRIDPALPPLTSPAGGSRVPCSCVYLPTSPSPILWSFRNSIGSKCFSDPRLLQCQDLTSIADSAVPRFLVSSRDGRWGSCPYRYLSLFGFLSVMASSRLSSLPPLPQLSPLQSC